ncbi:OJ1116_C07.12 [Oryza sativa Japonica Group]|uniref:OJ1116_C07.12 protein n=1 Tax=Oryza sativa subsp. japonica TaxID=39947 RepID=Q7F0T3_ORYSJ|nr:OJ1116_C07.12 [Oryza sativa Japonica Group]
MPMTYHLSLSRCHICIDRRSLITESPCPRCLADWRACHQKEHDADITISDTYNNNPPPVTKGPITRARAQQLNLVVSSFLYSSLYEFENRLLPNDYIVIRNNGGDNETLGEGLRVINDHRGRPSQGGGPNKVDFECNSESSTRFGFCLDYSVENNFAARSVSAREEEEVPEMGQPHLGPSEPYLYAEEVGGLRFLLREGDIYGYKYKPPRKRGDTPRGHKIHKPMQTNMSPDTDIRD